ncbi:hypothetical protein GLYMA_17G099866v4 [Glycine max]|nr:hypothetical protein GLYMA_17G099866v4 [Glycine max]KAH1117743.1 hypothetical protein GYH30_046825 [Glycine max]
MLNKKLILFVILFEQFSHIADQTKDFSVDKSSSYHERMVSNS